MDALPECHGRLLFEQDEALRELQTGRDLFLDVDQYINLSEIGARY
jgi:hypothetical protein